MLTKGDKLVVKNDISSFLQKGDIVEVINADEGGMIAFSFCEGMHKGLMTTYEFENYFEPYVEKAPTITEEDIDNIIENSEIETITMFDKCTVVSCKLPNGFVITESSACVSPENYDEDMGVEICLERIKNKLWELEGYRLQCELYHENTEECEDECEDEEECVHCYNEGNCDDCDCHGCEY